MSDEPGGHGFSPVLQSGAQSWFESGSPGSPPGSSPVDGDVEHGNLSDVVARRGPWNDHDAYVCGPSAMVGHTVEQLSMLGVPRDRIRLETFADAQR